MPSRIGAGVHGGLVESFAARIVPPAMALPAIARPRVALVSRIAPPDIALGRIALVSRIAPPRIAALSRIIPPRGAMALSRIIPPRGAMALSRMAGAGQGAIPALSRIIGVWGRAPCAPAWLADSKSARVASDKRT
jgi:hypothetical protein